MGGMHKEVTGRYRRAGLQPRVFVEDENREVTGRYRRAGLQPRVPAKQMKDISIRINASRFCSENYETTVNETVNVCKDGYSIG